MSHHMANGPASSRSSLISRILARQSWRRVVAGSILLVALSAAWPAAGQQTMQSSLVTGDGSAPPPGSIYRVGCEGIVPYPPANCGGDPLVGPFPGSYAITWGIPPYPRFIASTSVSDFGCLPYSVAWTDYYPCSMAEPCPLPIDLVAYAAMGSVDGSVTNADGSPAAGVTVTVRDPKWPDQQVFSVDTDAQGRYDFTIRNAPVLRNFSANRCGSGLIWMEDGIVNFSQNHWGLNVGGDGKGVARLRYVIGAAGGATSSVEVRSSETTHKDLRAWAEPEDPSIRPPVQGGSGTPQPNEACSEEGLPVNVLTGNMWLDHSDAQVGGIMGLAFVRSYNSKTAQTGRYGAFGPGWNHSYERRVSSPTPGLLQLRQRNGAPIYFVDENGDLTFTAWAPATEKSSITKVGSAYVRQFRAGGSETYDAATGRLTAITSRVNGVATSLTYDGSGRLISVTDPGSRQLTLGYVGASLHPTTLTGPSGLIATYEYSGDYLYRVTYADGDGDGNPDGGYVFTYHPSGELWTVQDLSGKYLETHTYAGGRALTSERSAGVELLTFAYHDFKTEVTDALAHTTTYDYVPFDGGVKRVTKISGPCASCGGGSETREWTYTDKGQVRTYKDGVGNVTTYDHDPVTGDLLTETRVANPNNAAATTHTTSYAYWPDGPPGRGRLHTKTEPNGAVTTYTYVDAGPETITQTVTDTQSRTVRLDYYPTTGQLWKLTDPLQKVTELSYLPVGDLEWVEDPLDHRTSFLYDLMGRRTQTIRPVTTPPNAEPITTYDTLGRIHRITNPDNTYAEFTYDGAGHRKTVLDFLGRLTTYHYDDYWRLERAVDALSHETKFGYDLMSHLRWITDARLKTTNFDVDAYGRVTKTTWPGGDNRFEEFTYDGAGRLATAKDRKGVITTYGYDGLGRLTTKTYGNGAPAVTFTYDEGTVAHKGRMTGATNEFDALTWEYDLAAQVRREKSAFNATTIDYDYYLDGSRKTVNLNGRLVGYDYYEDGELHHVTWGPETDPNAYSFTFDHDAAHRRRSLAYPNGAVTTYTPDLLSRLENIKTLVGSNTVTESSYVYDAVGNRVQRRTPTLGVDYAYDDLYRLMSAHATPLICPPPLGCLPKVLESYTHDEVGNRLRDLDARSNWSYNDRNELLTAASASFTYDLNGNLATRAEGGNNWIYEWSVENELTRVVKNGNEVASFKYDALGRRIQKTAGTTTKFAYDGAAVLREKIPGVNYRYVHGPGIDEPLAVENMSTAGGGDLSYYHADGLGSIVKVTNPAGAVTLTRTYNSFGVPTDGATTAGYAFTGREWDPETGLYYYRARYYDPKLGRFISEDPIGFAGGDINLYAYVWNNPLNFVDPEGLMGKGERGKAAKPEGSGDEFKKMKPHPTDPNKVKFKDPHSGKEYDKPKPPGFQDWWDKKHGNKMQDACGPETWEVCYGPVCFEVECNGWLCAPPIPPPPPVLVPPPILPPFIPAIL